MNDLVIMGAGGFAREVAFLVDDINRGSSTPQWNLLGFVVGDRDAEARPTGKYPVAFDEMELLAIAHDIHVVIGIGDPATIRTVHEKLRGCSHARYPNLIHPNVVMDVERVRLGQGNIICAGNVFTTDIAAGSFNIFNVNGAVGHDVSVGDYCVINSGANLSGGTTVEDGCLIGTGAVVLQNVTVGKGATVGLGAIVVQDVAPETTVFGVPARRL